jgi:hypothetical protein
VCRGRELSATVIAQNSKLRTCSLLQLRSIPRCAARAQGCIDFPMSDAFMQICEISEK